jgi:hypothetical protein
MYILFPFFGFFSGIPAASAVEKEISRGQPLVPNDALVEEIKKFQ